VTGGRVLEDELSSASTPLTRPLVASDAAERVIRDRVAKRSVERWLPAPACADRDDEHTVQAIIEEVATFERRAVMTNSALLVDADGVKRRLFDTVFGLGILQPLMDDPRVEEIIINGPLRIFAIRDGRKEPVSDVYFDTDEELRNLIKRIVSTAGRRLDEAAPMVDVRLRDGSRLNAVIPPAATRWTSVTVRKFAMRVHSLGQLVELGALSLSGGRVPRCGRASRREHPGQWPDRPVRPRC
jgi:hypothetical protein